MPEMYVVKDLSEYKKKYPELAYDVWDFFVNHQDIKSSYSKYIPMNPDLGLKCAEDFSNHYKSKYKAIGIPKGMHYLIQPEDIAKICRILYDKNFLQKYEFGIFNNRNDVLTFWGNPVGFGKRGQNIPKRVLIRHLNNVVYGSFLGNILCWLKNEFKSKIFWTMLILLLSYFGYHKLVEWLQVG
ncbi:MAG: hypothetical protein FWD15_05325 [Alphaproteobacteria bacterium]|nr:hypothetical protein [Alphaproteobacteria bacterium]